MNATHPQGALSSQLSFLGPHPRPSGHPEATGQVPGALGGDRPAAPGAGMGGGSASPPAWVPSSEPLGCELAGPHRLFGSLRLINRPGVRGELRGGMPSACCVGQLLPAPSAGHHATSLRESEPARGRIGKWGTWPDRPAPLPGCLSCIPQITKHFLLYPHLTRTCPES